MPDPALFGRRIESAGQAAGVEAATPGVVARPPGVGLLRSGRFVASAGAAGAV